MIVNQQSGLYLGGNAQYAGGFGAFNPYDYSSGGTTPVPPIPPTPTPTPPPAPPTLQSGHVIWGKVAGEWIEREKDRLSPQFLEHLKTLGPEGSSPITVSRSESVKPWSKLQVSSKAEVLKYIGLSSTKEARSRDAAVRLESVKAMKLRRMIDEEDELLLYFEGKI